MREYTLHKDGRPRFFGGAGENTVIVDASGYHEYCKTCKRIQLEYRTDGRASERTCHCALLNIEHLITQLWHTIDQCNDVEAVKRQLMVLISHREMMS